MLTVQLFGVTSDQSLFFMSLVESRRSKVFRSLSLSKGPERPQGLCKKKSSVEGRLSKIVGTHGRASVLQNATHQWITKSPIHVSALHSKPTLFAAFLLFLAKNAMSASLLNARHTQKCISAQSRCLFIESPQPQFGPFDRLRDRIGPTYRIRPPFDKLRDRMESPKRLND